MKGELIWDGGMGSECNGSTVVGAFASMPQGCVLNIARRFHGAKLPFNITCNNLGFGIE